jgi:PAS domain S-box-containing protein
MDEAPVGKGRRMTFGWRVLLFVAAYFLAGRLGLLFADPPSLVAAIWPPAGVALAGALHLGRHGWLVLWIVTFLAGSLWAAIDLADPWIALAVATATATGSTLRAVAGAWILRQVSGPLPSLTRVRTMAGLILGAGVVASLASATVGVGARLLAGFVEPAMVGRAWLTWWLADTAGIAIVAPVLLLWLERPRRPRRSRLETFGHALLFGLVSVVGLARLLGPDFTPPVFVLLFPLVVWPAFRFGATATAQVIAVLSAVVLWGEILHVGPLAQSDPSMHLLLVQVVLIVLATTGLGLAAAVEERGEASRRLAETTSLLRGVTEGTPDVVFVKDLDGRYLLMNEAGARYSGRVPEDVIGRTDAELFDPDLVRQIQTYDALVLETGEVRTDEYAEVRDGVRRTFLATKGPVRDAHGDIVGIFGISREITTRKLERMLLNGILEGTPDLVSAVDLDFRFVAFNQALKDEYRKGFGVDLVQGAKLSDLLADHPEALARRLQLLGRAFRGEQARATWAMGPHTTDAKWVDVLASPLRDETDHVIGGALIGRDVTKAREAETALRASQSRFRALSLQAPVGMFETDLSGRCTFVNDAWCALTGRSEAEALGHAWNQVVHPDDIPRVVFAWDETVERGRTFRLQCRLLRGDGRVLFIMGAAEPLRDARGSVIGYLGTAVDVSEQRRAEEHLHRTTEALASANKELESFSYSVSHDLRAPLRGIDGFSRALEEDYGERLDGEARGYITRIRNATQRMGQIIDDLLLLSRVARSEIQRETVDISALAREVDAALRTAEPFRELVFRVQEDLRVDADGRLVRLLLENLLGNAWKYTSRNARAVVEVGASDGEGETVFFVRDDGAGFDMAYVHKLFGPFSRLHGTSEYPGSGIGLATVARIAARHGGRVWAVGEPGRGATFFFTLAPGGSA